MSLTLLTIIAWLGLMPLCFWVGVLLAPAHLHRRAIAGARPQVAEIVDLQSARERRAASAARKYEAI